MKTLTLTFSLLFFTSSLFSEIRATYNNDQVEIWWTNPTHIKVDFFVVERSKNGSHFEQVILVDGPKHNNSRLLEYFEIDNNPFNKKAFYRIKQVDINGAVYYSDIVFTKNISNAKSLFSLFSNSESSNNIKNYTKKDLLVVLIDGYQKEYIAKVNIISRDNKLVITQSNIILPKGTYIITATSDDAIYGKKTIVDMDIFVNSVYTQSK